MLSRDALWFLPFRGPPGACESILGPEYAPQPRARPALNERKFLSLDAIRAALQGKTYLTPQLAGEVLEAMKQAPDQTGDPIGALTPRQREVLQLLAEGRSAKEIAASLSISARTVEFHKYQMMEALDIHTSAELVHFAIKHGLVKL